MKSAVKLTVLAVAILVACVTAQQVTWKRTADGFISVTAPNIPGTQYVIVYTSNLYGDQDYFTIIHLSGDDKWRGEGTLDVPSNSEIRYTVEYSIPGSANPQVNGTYKFVDSHTETGLTLGEPRFLKKRAHTVLYDDFSSGHIDSSKWDTDIMLTGLGFTIWSPESRNSYIKNGNLYIKPTLTTDRFGDNIMNSGTIDAKQTWGACHPVWGSESCVTHGQRNRPVMSASLRSHATIKYGRVEVVAQLPKGDWIWPAIWLMPKNGHYGGWPQSGEIDIMEACGNLHLTHPNGQSVGVDRFGSNIHYGNSRDGSGHKSHQTDYRLHGSTWADGFHTYWLDWSADHIKTGVDQHTVMTINTPSTSFWQDAQLTGDNIWAHGGKNAPFDQPFYLILNVAVGGGYFWSGFHNEPYPRPWSGDNFHEFWTNKHLWYPTWHGEDVAMKIKSVKMEQY